MTCNECGTTSAARYCRGVCGSCYQRHKRNGTLDTLPVGRKPGHCKAGHNLDEVGRTTSGSCRACKQAWDRQRKADQRRAQPGWCRKGLHDLTQPGAVYLHKDGKHECRECALERSNPGGRRKQPGCCVNGHDRATYGHQRPDGSIRCTECARLWHAANQPQRIRPPKPPKPPKVKPPKSKLPAGWDRITPKPKAAIVKGGGTELGPVQPTEPDQLIAASHVVHLWWVLEPEVGCDLAAMLGLEGVA